MLVGDIIFDCFGFADTEEVFHYKFSKIEIGIVLKQEQIAGNIGDDIWITMYCRNGFGEWKIKRVNNFQQE